MTDKLEIGAFATVRPGWLCTDIDPHHPEVMKMDATKPFPFADGTFRFIYCEHMIEHATLSDGQFMLGECFRVLKSGGVLRVVTPTIDFLIAIMSQKHPDYVAWAAATFCSDSPSLPSVVFNNFVRAWGHLFIYDRRTLFRSMRQAGFHEFDEPQLQASRHPELRGLAFEQ